MGLLASGPLRSELALMSHLGRNRARRREFLAGLGTSLATRAAQAQGLYPTCGSASVNPAQSSLPATYDVVIYGATVAGIGAAYTARLMGKKVLLIQHDWFGGMTGAGGLTNLDLYYPNVQGGIWWQMFQKMASIEGVARASAEEDRHQSSRTM